MAIHYASVVKDETILPSPNRIEFFDLGSGTTNESHSPGNIGRITMDTANRFRRDRQGGRYSTRFVAATNCAARIPTRTGTPKPVPVYSRSVKWQGLLPQNPVGFFLTYA
jgi:hypothetical protein